MSNDKGKPIERWGRKATGLKRGRYDSRVAELGRDRDDQIQSLFGLDFFVFCGNGNSKMRADDQDHQR